MAAGAGHESASGPPPPRQFLHYRLTAEVAALLVQHVGVLGAHVESGDAGAWDVQVGQVGGCG